MGERKPKLCAHGICTKPAKAGTQFCENHQGSNQFPWLGAVVFLAIILGIGYFLFQACSGSGSGSGGGRSPGAGSSANDASLSADASAYLSANFAGDPAYLPVQSLEVKSGILWIYTSLPAGDVSSATAVCGVGSAWAFGDSTAIDAGVWGVSVRAADGQRLVQRDGFRESCS